MSSELHKHKIMSLTQEVISVIQETDVLDAVNVLANSLLSVMMNTEIVYRLANENMRLILTPTSPGPGIPDVKKVIMAREIGKEGKELCELIENVVNEELKDVDPKPRSTQLVIALSLFVNDIANAERDSMQPDVKESPDDETTEGNEG